MHNALLVSGALSAFVPIGMDGAPIYKNADAFRDALERTPNLGSRDARFLAVPRFNGDESSADWYVPFPPANADGEYRIVSWQAASAGERAHALAELTAFEERLTQEGQKLLSMAPSGDLLLFAHYLTGMTEAQKLPAVHFPGSEYLFIVDGQPVITFWGFIKAGARLNASPFACLKSPAVATSVPGTGTAAVPPSAPAASATKRALGFPRWLWWLLIPLLLLLLLALLLWLLWRFFGFRLPWFDFNLPGFDLGGGQVELSVPDAELNLPTVDLDAPVISVDGGGISVPEASVQTEGVIDPGLATDAVISSAPEAEQGQIAEAELAEQTDPLPEGVLPEAGQDVQPPVAENGAETVEHLPPADSNLPEAEPAAQTDAETTSPAAAKIPQPAQPAMIPQALGSKTAGNALRLDPKALAAGDVSALQGNWQTRSGMMDVNTGRPLNLSYRFENGQGELTVRRQDGTRCVAKANPQAGAGVLNINPAGAAICPDNSSYNLPRIKCTPRQDGSADCFAVYSEKQQFPLRIYGATTEQ